MRKIIEEISIWYIILFFGLSPIIMFIMYITYTEKIVIPILLSLLLLASYIIIRKEK